MYLCVCLYKYTYANIYMYIIYAYMYIIYAYICKYIFNIRITQNKTRISKLFTLFFTVKMLVSSLKTYLRFLLNPSYYFK